MPGRNASAEGRQGFGTRDTSAPMTARGIRWVNAPVSPFAGMRGLPPPRRSGVYFVLSGDRVKIGVADNIRTRIQKIRSTCPYEPVLLAVMRGDERTEAAMHALFAGSRLHCEWFGVTDAMVALIQEARKLDLDSLDDREARKKYERLVEAFAGYGVAR